MNGRRMAACEVSHRTSRAECPRMYPVSGTLLARSAMLLCSLLDFDRTCGVTPAQWSARAQATGIRARPADRHGVRDARDSRIRHPGHTRGAEDLASPRDVNDHPPQSTTDATPSRTEPAASARLRTSTRPGPGCHDDRRVALVACTSIILFSIEHLIISHQYHPPQPGSRHRISNRGTMPGPVLLEAREGHEPVVAVQRGDG